MMNLFLVYQFLKRLAKPFKEWDAYDLGIIDEKGNILKKRKDLNTVKERNAFGAYDLMILNLKKIIEKIPGGKSPIASYAAALYLLKEWNHFTKDSLLTESTTDEEILESLDSFHSIIFSLDKSIIQEELDAVNQKMHDYEKKLDELSEEPVNTAGSGNIAGIGVGPNGEPGLTRAQRIKYIAKNRMKKKERKGEKV